MGPVMVLLKMMLGAVTLDVSVRDWRISVLAVTVSAPTFENESALIDRDAEVSWRFPERLVIVSLGMACDFYCD